jgi:hypothetical protein
MKLDLSTLALVVGGGLVLWYVVDKHFRSEVQSGIMQHLDFPGGGPCTMVESGPCPAGYVYHGRPVMSPQTARELPDAKSCCKA